MCLEYFYQALPVRNVCCLHVIIFTGEVSGCCASSKVGLSQRSCCAVSDQQSPQTGGEAKHLVEGDGDEIRRAVPEVQRGTADIGSCIQQNKPAASAVARRVQTSGLDAPHIAQGVLSSRKIALCWVTEQVCCLAKSIFLWAVLFFCVFHFFWKDRQGSDPQGRGLSPHAHNRGMVVRQI